LHTRSRVELHSNTIVAVDELHWENDSFVISLSQLQGVSYHYVTNQYGDAPLQYYLTTPSAVITANNARLWVIESNNLWQIFPNSGTIAIDLGDRDSIASDDFIAHADLEECWGFDESGGILPCRPETEYDQISDGHSFNPTRTATNTPSLTSTSSVTPTDLAPSATLTATRSPTRTQTLIPTIDLSLAPRTPVSSTQTAVPTIDTSNKAIDYIDKSYLCPSGMSSTYCIGSILVCSYGHSSATNQEECVESCQNFDYFYSGTYYNNYCTCASHVPYTGQ
jgi:hypothetical protein